MDARVIPIHHNCFVVHAGPRTLLFDRPAERFRPEGADKAIRREIAGRDLIVFFSHSHADHCAADVLEIIGETASTGWALGYDVPDMIPELAPAALPGPACVVDPDDPPCRLPGSEQDGSDDVEISGLESSDLGVGFLIRLPQGRIWFGGDVARWAWPKLPETAKRIEFEHFEENLRRIAEFAPDLAFQNADPRLKDLAGFERFKEVVKAERVVAMHRFGRGKSKQATITGGDHQK